jgi:hypothetical protein
LTTMSKRLPVMTGCLRWNIRNEGLRNLYVMQSRTTTAMHPCFKASVCISYCSRCSYFLSVFLHPMPYFTSLPLNVTVLHYNVLQSSKMQTLSHYRHAGDKGERKYTAPTHSWPRHLIGVSGQRHDPAALYPRGNNPRYPLDRRQGGSQTRSGHRG